MTAMPEGWSRHASVILQAAGEGIIGLDDDGVMIFVNPAAASMAGYEVEALVGQGIHYLLHHANADGSPCAVAKCPFLAVFRDGAVHRVSGEVFWRSNGTTFPIEYVSTPMTEQGVIVGAVVVVRDISQRRKAEERQALLLGQAAAAEAKFRGLLESAPDAIVIVDHLGCIVLVNRQAEAMFGYDRDELLGELIERLIPHRYRAGHVPYRDRYFGDAHTRPMGNGLDLYALRKDGTEFPTEISLSPIELEGELLVISMIRDITERRRASEALRESEERFRLLVRAVEDYAIFMLTPEGHVATWNVGAERLKGYTAAEIIGAHFSRFWTPEDVVAGIPIRALEQAARFGRHEEESWFVRKDGSRFQAISVITALRDPNGRLRGFATVTRDVTGQRELERQKDEFLANVSHDLRTPLAAIKASIGVVLANEPRATPPPIHRLLTNIDLASSHMARMVDDLLELTRVHVGRVRLKPIRCDLRLLAQRCARAIEPLADAQGQHVTLSLPDRPIWAMVDAQRIERALLNLISNAQKYGRRGGMIHVSLEEQADADLFAVADDGVGILPDEQERIFERFYRPETESTTGRQGSGLGLPIALAMVELHGGRTWVESVPGEGSVFFIRLPRGDPAAAAEPRTGTESDLSDGPGERTP